jgi:chloramphenicol-sensitive protein RarD
MLTMSTRSTHTPVRQISGINYALAAFILWGFLPLFWKMLGSFHAAEILANRIIWSVIFVFGLLYQRKQIHEVRAIFRSPRKLGLVMLSSVIISGNWFVYIWAVNSDHVIETSMGYYINPLIVILMGMLILKEKLDRLESIAIIMAFAGVMIMTLRYGQVPWISLFLATSFSLYGLCKKLVQVESLVALGIETLLVSPIALGYLIINRDSFITTLTAASPVTVILLILTGIFTALPLLWFARAARLVTLSVLGFAQYLSPTITLLLGVFLFREPFTAAHGISFGFIWTGLAIFSFAQTQKLREIKRNRMIIKGE